MDDNNKASIEKIEQEVLLVHDSFWKALGDRDVDNRFINCADSITFIGSGLNEKAANKEEYIAINKKGIEQYPQKFEIKTSWRRVSVFENVALVETEVEWQMIFNGRADKEMLRNTVVLKKFDNKWLIIHVHGSMPDYRLAGQDYMTNDETSKRNIELEQQVFIRTKELHETMDDLKATQAQLIQAEKMASLGELTAGIAHEIQNPLNFVNNFSELNSELIAEMKEELKKGKMIEVEQIANDIDENEQKIIFHGKRAEGIVKGMLQHSRSSNGQKESTDINALTDEYARLAYHGLRAKDKSFNATMKTDYDISIGNINVVPQDIGRVILNLITNAFYVVDEKKKAGVAGFEPTVTISTKKINDNITITVADNGNGIPAKIVEKIFQPFFTTKPTGQGTGLGLSLSYDMIKAHDGEIKVNTVEGQGTEFIIVLPT